MSQPFIVALNRVLASFIVIVLIPNIGKMFPFETVSHLQLNVSFIKIALVMGSPHDTRNPNYDK